MNHNWREYSDSSSEIVIATTSQDSFLHCQSKYQFQISRVAAASNQAVMVIHLFGTIVPINTKAKSIHFEISYTSFNFTIATVTATIMPQDLFNCRLGNFGFA